MRRSKLLLSNALGDEPTSSWHSPIPRCATNLAIRCFPLASPISLAVPGKQNAAPKGRFKSLLFLRKTGAGEGIRTLDPNLGKVVLYP